MKFGEKLVLVLTLAVSSVLVAQAADKGNITLSDTTQVGSQLVKAGNYTVQWEGTGPSVPVKIMHGKKVVASGTANLVRQQTPVGRDEVHVRVQDNGTRNMERIDFARRGVSLVFGENQMANGQ